MKTEIEILKEEIGRLQELIIFQHKTTGSLTIRVEVKTEKLSNGNASLVVLGTHPSGGEEALVRTIVEELGKRMDFKPKQENILAATIHQEIKACDLSDWEWIKEIKK